MGGVSSTVKYKINEAREQKSKELILENCSLSALPSSGCCGASLDGLAINKLDVSHNRIKTLSKNLMDLQLNSVNFSYNNLTNVDLLAEIQSLTDINISYNNFLTIIPDFPYAVSLDISATKINPLPQDLRLAKIQHLGISTLKLTEFPKIVLAFPALMSLDISFNEITVLPEEISIFKSMTSLDISSNPISFLPTQIGDLKTLKIFKLKQTLKLSKLPDSFSNLTNLELIDITGGRVQEFDINFKHWSNLKTIEYNSGGFKSFSAKSALSIPYLTSLERVSLAFNQMKTVPKEFGFLSSLRQIDLRSNLLTKIPGEFSFLNPSKVSLELENNPLNEPFHSLLATGIPALLKGIKIYCSAYGPNCYFTETIPKPIIARKPNEFEMQACDFGGEERLSGKDKFDGKLTCLKGPLKDQEIDCFIREKGGKAIGKYAVFFNLHEEGIYKLSITFDGKSIKSSPFILRTEQYLDAEIESDNEEEFEEENNFEQQQRKADEDALDNLIKEEFNEDENKPEEKESKSDEESKAEPESKEGDIALEDLSKNNQTDDIDSLLRDIM